MSQPLLREALEQQLATLESLRGETLGQHVDVCIYANCFVPRSEHVKSNHYPQYWPIDQALRKLRDLIAGT